MRIQLSASVSARQNTPYWALISWVLLLIIGSAQFSYAQTFQGPLIITKGGTYTGNWESQDSNTPAVSVNTAEPVIIENSIIRSRGMLIRAHYPGSNITVRNTSGYGLTPSIDNVKYGRFIDANGFKNIRLEHNYLERTSGIYLAYYKGNQSAGETVKILYNKASNIDGRTRNGGREWSQFVQFNSVRRVRGAEIAWNQVVNEPYKSRVEENINLYMSNGTSDSPILIHDNYIQGAYPNSPGTEADYGGGGINMGDGPTDKIEAASGFVKAYNNQIISTGTQGICISTGHDMEFYNNRIISSGYLEDGTYIRAQNVGIYIMKLGSSSSIFFNNKAYNNVIGYVNRNTNGERQRNDQYLPHAVEPHRYNLNTELPNPITRDTEKAEFVSWNVKLKSSGIVVGPTTGAVASTPAPAPAPTPGSTAIVSGGTYKLTHQGTNQVLEVADNSTQNGANVRQWDDLGGGNQRWILTLQGDGSYKLKNKTSGKVLDVDNNSNSDGANVQQWDDNGSSAQRWVITRQSDGSYELLHKGTTKVLDVDNNSNRAGANVQQWSDNGSSAQRWILTRDGTSVSSNAVSSSSQATVASSTTSAAKATTDLALYPNPASEYVMLPTGTDFIQLVNQSGRTVLEKRGALVNRLDIQTIPKGLYQVRVGEKGKTSSQRLQVN